MNTIPLAEGRNLFGNDPATYAAARPDYPEEMFQLLVDRCGLRPGSAVFEIGAGTGIATKHLLAHGASPLRVIEPDPRLVAYLRETITSSALQLDQSAFEDAVLPEQGFDLGVAATSFHWLDPHMALPKVHDALKPGGWWSMCWNCCDYGEPDAFHHATDHLFDAIPNTPTCGSPHSAPFPLDRDRRLQDLAVAGFGNTLQEIWRRTFTYDTAWIVSLYSTFSSIQTLAPDRRKSFLEELAQIADSRFDGRVEREVITVLYAGQRRK